VCVNISQALSGNREINPSLLTFLINVEIFSALRKPFSANSFEHRKAIAFTKTIVAK
jgi:hypothetical protein